MKQPTKAIICAAGLGTRFLPVTKSIPKEMLPLIDKPVIQYIVEQATMAGVTDIVIVTGSNKRAIEDHFDRAYELERELRDSGKENLAKDIEKIAEMANFIYLRQKGTPKGNARPILNSQHLIDKDEPFFVFFADDFFISDTIPWTSQLLETYNRTGKSAISLVKVDINDADKYGMASLGHKLSENIVQISSLIEKPGRENSPSTYASAGSYLLTPNIFDYLEKEQTGIYGEITLADSINELSKNEEVYGCIIEGTWYDTGDQIKYIKTLVDMTLKDIRFKDEFKLFLKTKIDS